MIDICDFAVGLSRQLYGLTIASERPGHHMRETWQPLGPVGVISAFNFPVAVWSWNAAIALVCGDSPDNLLQVLIGHADVGQAMVDDERIPLISATGSTRMGKIVGERVAQRMGKSLLELGGNNAMIVTPSADMDLVVRAIVFSAVGTAGQRCTTLRRLIVHESMKKKLMPALKKAYETLEVGSPLKKKTLIGPLIDQEAFDNMQTALKNAKKQGGRVLTGGQKVKTKGGYYAKPALVDMPSQGEVVCHETFAPILYVMTYKEFEEAIEMNNAVPQGLSSCIFTTDVREAEGFLSATGSDCGIANVNIGPSGAEIGGAFGGEKETGGGRESGSDAWKTYMRRQTQTVNYSTELPLAQGVKFDL